MALDMSQIERIRDLRALGYSPSEIKRETGYSYPTIRKYLAIDDWIGNTFSDTFLRESAPPI